MEYKDKLIEINKLIKDSNQDFKSDFDALPTVKQHFAFFLFTLFLCILSYVFYEFSINSFFESANDEAFKYFDLQKAYNGLFSCLLTILFFFNFSLKGDRSLRLWFEHSIFGKISGLILYLFILFAVSTLVGFIFAVLTYSAIDEFGFNKNYILISHYILIFSFISGFLLLSQRKIKQNSIKKNGDETIVDKKANELYQKEKKEAIKAKSKFEKEVFNKIETVEDFILFKNYVEDYKLEELLKYYQRIEESLLKKYGYNSDNYIMLERDVLMNRVNHNKNIIQND